MYVWDAGLVDNLSIEQNLDFSETNSYGGSLFFKGMVGVSLSFQFGFIGATKTEASFLAGGHVVETGRKKQTTQESRQLAIEFNPEYRDVLDPTKCFYLHPGKKVDRYTFDTFLLQADYDNFDAFYRNVVDKTWLYTCPSSQKGADVAKKLREAQNCRNEAWRVLYRVGEISFSGVPFGAEAPTILVEGTAGDSAAGEAALVQGTRLVSGISPKKPIVTPKPGAAAAPPKGLVPRKPMSRELENLIRNGKITLLK